MNDAGGALLGGRRFVPDPSFVAVVVPATLLGLWSPWPVLVALAVVALATCVVALEAPRLERFRPFRLPLVLAMLGLPTLLALPVLPAIAAALAGGFALLGWLGRVPKDRRTPARWIRGLLPPAAVALLATTVALGAPEIAAGPGIAALLLLVTVLLLAALLFPREASPEGAGPALDGASSS